MGAGGRSQIVSCMYSAVRSKIVTSAPVGIVDKTEGGKKRDF